MGRCAYLIMLPQNPVRAVPIKLTLWGLVGSWGTATASVALSDPAAVGWNVTATVQLELPASVPVQVPPVIVKSLALGPPVLLLTEIENGDLLERSP